MILANGEDSILKSKRNLSVCIVATYVVLILFFSSGYKGTVAKEVADADDSISAKPGTALYYALEVEKELGPLPHFNCNDCLEIPITQNGVQVLEKVDWCDKPAAFGDPCQIGNRVGRIQGTHANGDPRPEVIYMMFCRDGGMGVIGHNSETGATAFFSVEEMTNVYAFIPGPHDPWYEKSWQSPIVVAADNCYKCHMADPFLHTPWIDQVRNPDKPGEPLVPLIASETSPYFFIGDEFPIDGPLQPSIDELVDNECISCHGAQCMPSFFNLSVDELEMPPPFFELHLETKMAEDRKELRAWCEEQEIEYFARSEKGDGKNRKEDFMWNKGMSQEEVSAILKTKGMSDEEIEYWIAGATANGLLIKGADSKVK